MARRRKTEPPPKTKRAVIYARYSSSNQREASIEQQVNECTEFAKRRGLDIVDIYADKAISGTTDNRPQFQRMLRDAERGLFDFVVAWKSSRIGRNMKDALLNDSILRSFGVICIYAEEAFDDTAAGRFALRNMMNVNQFYSENLSEDVKRGLMDNAQKCMVNGRPAFGYKKGEDGRFAVNEEEADVVREIYARVASGWKQIDIVRDLNRRGIKTRTGNEWKPSSFNFLLQNEQYIGVYQYADVRIEGGMPAIMDKSLFDEVQKVLETKGHPRGRKRGPQEYILTGRLFCGKCKSPMVGVSGRSHSNEKYYYYACQKRLKGKCDKKYVSKKFIEDEVIKAVKTMILDDKCIDWIVETYRKNLAAFQEDSPIPGLERELKRVNKSLDNLIKAIENGLETESTKQRLFDLEAEKKRLRATIDAERELARETSPEEVRFAIEWYRDKNLQNIEYQKDLISLFIQAIYLYDDHLLITTNYMNGANITVPVSASDAAAANDDMVNCSNKIQQTVPFRYYTNPEGFIVGLHPNGIVIWAPLAVESAGY